MFPFCVHVFRLNSDQTCLYILSQNDLNVTSMCIVIIIGELDACINSRPSCLILNLDAKHANGGLAILCNLYYVVVRFLPAQVKLCKRDKKR